MSLMFSMATVGQLVGPGVPGCGEDPGRSRNWKGRDFETQNSSSPSESRRSALRAQGRAIPLCLRRPGLPSPPPAESSNRPKVPPSPAGNSSK